MVHADDLSVCGSGPSQYFKESNVVLYSFPVKFKIVSKDPSPMMRKPCLREKLCLILNGGIFVWSSPRVFSLFCCGSQNSLFHKDSSSGRLKSFLNDLDFGVLTDDESG